mgnify:FL=1
MSTKPSAPQPQQIRQVIAETSGPSRLTDEITLQYAYFDGNAKLGKQINTTFAEWVAGRSYAATLPWPNPLDKNSLPSERGAILAQSDDDPDLVRGRAEDVLGLTWLFIDCDDGTSPVSLRQSLAEADVCFFLTESATSRRDGAPLKWHLFLPLDEIVSLPSRGGLQPDAAADLLQLHKQWWRDVRRHVVKLLFTMGRVPDDTRDDTSIDTLERKAFVPHCPIDGAQRGVYSQGGRCLNLKAFLTATKFAQPEPPGVGILASLPDSRRGRVSGVGAAVGVAPSTTSTASPALPTPGETTGTLLYKVFGYFGMLGPHQGQGKYFVRCPWAENHNGGRGQDHLDSSTVIFTTGSTTGGFKCQHEGGGIPGQCSMASAGDVLRWARRKGVPAAVLPDRSGFGALGASDAEAAAATIEDSGETTVSRDGDGEAEKAAVAVALTATPAAAPPAAPTQTTAPPAPPQLRRKKPVPAASSTAFPLATDVATPAPPSASPQQPGGDKVEIEITEDLIIMRDLAVRAISQHDRIFKIDGKLFDRVEPDDALDRKGQPRAAWLRKTAAPHLTVEIQRTSTWFKVARTAKSVERVAARPDSQVIATVLAAGSYPGVRELRGIVSTPVFRPDGTLFQRPGYDHQLHVIYEPAMRPDPIPLEPSRQQCEEALADLRYVLVDFPFEEPDLAAAVWLSAIFTKLLRFAFSGNIPLLAASAGMASSGKGKLPDTAAIITEGAEAEKRNYTGDDAEDERVIGSTVADEVPVAVLDNIKRGIALASAAFEMYLTTPKFATRRIGTSENIRVEKGSWTDTLWWATGNDLTTSGDMARRVLRIGINDRTGRPEDREVAESDLEGYCKTNRKRLLTAALTLLSGFFAARRKGWAVELPPFASFEAWSIVRHAVVWCGLPDPFLARGKISEDAVRADFGFTVEHLRKVLRDKPMHMKRIVDILRSDAEKTLASRMYDEVWSFFIDRGVKLDGRDVSGASSALGRFLKDYNGQVYVAADGKCWQLWIGRDRCGSLVSIVETTGA